MAFYVEITPQCKKDAKHHSIENRIKKLKDRVEKGQNLSTFELRPFPFLLNKLKNFRLIASRHKIDEKNEVILFLRILVRGSKEYDEFVDLLKDDVQEARKKYITYTKGEIEHFFETIVKTEAENIKKSQPPTPEEKRWLYYPLDKNEDFEDEFILESRDWVEHIKDSFSSLTVYRIILEKMIDDLHRGGKIRNPQIYWGKSDLKDYGIVYAYYPEQKRILLFKPIRRGNDIERILNEYVKQLEKLNRDKNPQISRLALRSYPSYMVSDESIWKAIEEEKEANMALSPEESDLLSFIRKPQEQGNYPLFISGRAGSGKSTMLQYLFADYVNFALEENLVDNPPIYITYSSDLLKQARETVSKILKSHYKFRSESQYDKKSKNIDSLLKKTFKVFHNFLHNLLPSDIKENFAEDKRINYAKFLYLWEHDFSKRSEAKKISPDIAWYVIRSYIKGMRTSLDDDLSPDEFKELPSKKRFVSDENYEFIYERVWKSWYKKLCNEKGYWDDQDLSAYILENENLKDVKYVAVFCDEAQDFTPLELDIIYQLSLFSDRSLSPEELSRVPIVFAGDPLQTINPTGFRWEDVKANFYERFKAILDPHNRRSSINLIYRELNYNYRSNPGIVKFSNLVQLVRSVLLNDRSIKPQTEWWIDAPVQVVWYDLNDSETQQQIKSHPEIVKIIDSVEGEEREYVENDNVLKDLPKSKPGGVYHNVFSVIRAKGLEFPKVVLYRFGERAPENFWDVLRGAAEFKDPDEKLTYEYFLNRLYVAVTRAKHQLIIVDRQETMESFWKFAKHDYVEEILNMVDAEKWRKFISYLVEGEKPQSEVWSGEKIDPLEQAQQYYKIGLSKRDPYYLKKAGIAYENAGKHDEAKKCYAESYKLEGEFKKCGNYYLELGMYEEAFDCYWRGKYWEEMVTLKDKATINLSSRLEMLVAEYMLEWKDIFNKELIQRLMETVEDKQWVNRAKVDSTWRYAFNKIAQEFSKVNEANKDLSIDVYSLFQNLKNKNFPIADKVLALLAFKAGEYKDAVAIWDSLNGEYTYTNEYYEAKSQIAPFPENILWLGKIGDYNSIIKEWNQKRKNIPDKEIDEKIASIVIAAAIKMNKLSLALEMLKKYPNTLQIYNLLQKAIKEGQKTIIDGIFDEAVRNLKVEQIHELFKEAYNTRNTEIIETMALLSIRRMLRKTINDVQRGYQADWFSLFKKITGDFSNITEKKTKLNYSRKSIDVMMDSVVDEISKLPITGVEQFFNSAVKTGDKNILKVATIITIRYLIRKRELERVSKAIKMRDISFLSNSLNLKEIRDKTKFKLIATEYLNELKILAIKEMLYNYSKDNNIWKSKIIKDWSENFIKPGELTYKMDLATIQMLGEFVERVGIWKNAIQFYENVLDSLNKKKIPQKLSKSKEIKEFVVRRLIKNMERFAAFLNRKHRKNEAENHLSKAKKLREEYGIAEQHFIPEYPLDIPDRWSGFKLSYSSEHERLRIENEKRFETVTLDIKNLELRGDLADVPDPQEKNDDNIRWYIKEWKLAIILYDISKSKTCECLPKSSNEKCLEMRLNKKLICLLI